MREPVISYESQAAPRERKRGGRLGLIPTKWRPRRTHDRCRIWNKSKRGRSPRTLGTRSTAGAHCYVCDCFRWLGQWLSSGTATSQYPEYRNAFSGFNVGIQERQVYGSFLIAYATDSASGTGKWLEQESGTQWLCALGSWNSEKWMVTSCCWQRSYVHWLGGMDWTSSTPSLLGRKDRDRPVVVVGTCRRRLLKLKSICLHSYKNRSGYHRISWVYSDNYYTNYYLRWKYHSASINFDNVIYLL